MFRISLILILALFLALPKDGLAQKKKRKHSEVRAQREAEFYFTEAEKYFILEDYDRALALFEEARNISSDNAAIYYKLAEIHEHKDDLSKAMTNINQALKLDQKNKYYYLLAANIHTRMGNFKDAAKLYEEMIQNIPKTDQYLLELAAIYLYENELDKAYKTYQRAEEYFGINEEIIAQKQKILLEQKNINGAIEEGLKLIRNNPENEIAVISQAELLVANNRMEDALVLLNDHILAFPEHKVVNMFIGNIYLQQGHYQKAQPYLLEAFDSPSIEANAKIQVLASLRTNLAGNELQELALLLAQKLVQAHEGISDAHSVYGDILFTVGKETDARAEYLKAIELDNSNFTLWQNVLQLYLQGNSYDTVLLLSEDALELFPNQNALYYYRGLAHLRKSDYQEAIADLKQGKMLSATDPKLISAFNSMLGEAYYGVKDYEKSDESFEAALDYDPDNPLVLNNYSFFLALRKEQLSKAAQMAQKLVEENPGVAAYTDTYAWVLYHQEKYHEAKKILDPVIKSGNAKASHYDHFGDILFKLGDKNQALKYWKLAREKDSSIKNIEKKIADQKIYE